MMDWDKIREERQNYHVFKTNFGYEGSKLDLAIGMFSLGFTIGFNDLKVTVEGLEVNLKNSRKYHVESVAKECKCQNAVEINSALQDKIHMLNDQLEEAHHLMFKVISLEKLERYKEKHIRNSNGL